MNIPFAPRPKVYTDSATLTNHDLFMEDQVIVATVSSKTYTLPTPVKDNRGRIAFFLNTAADTQILSCSGGFVGGGNTVTVAATSAVMLYILPTASATYKWAVIGVGSATALSTEVVEDVVGAMFSTSSNIVTYSDGTSKMDFTPLAEYIADTVGAMVTGNTETGIAVTYQDGDNTIDFVVTNVLSTDEYNAVHGAASPSAANVFATINDVDTPTPAGIGTTITDCSAKATPVDADLLLVSDSAASWVGKKSTLAELRSVLMSANALGGVIAGMAAKSVPIDADSIVICDSADTNDAKETTISELRTAMLTANGLGTGIAALDAKATPIDADSIIICDSADTNDAKETTIGELKAVILSANNVGGAIAGYAAKASPIDADSIAICDSADTNDAKETTISELRAAILAADPLGGIIAGLTAKSTPIDADSIVICDSAATNDAKETTIGELRSVLLASDPLGTIIAGLDAKATPIGADSIILCDSADTNNAKEVTLTALTTAVLGTALTGSVNWQDWSPTIASVPATDAVVARYQRVGNTVNFTIDARGSDGDAWTPSTITLPVAPVDQNHHVPLNAIQNVNAGTYSNPLAYIDAETNLNIKFRAAASCTDAAAWSLHVSGSYEVAAA